MGKTREEQRKEALRLFADILKGKDTSSKPLPPPPSAPPKPKPKPQPAPAPAQAPAAQPAQPAPPAKPDPQAERREKKRMKQRVPVRGAPKLVGEPKRRSRAALLEEARLKREEQLALQRRRERELQAAARPSAPSRPTETVSSGPGGRPPRRIDPRYEGAAAKREEQRMLRERRDAALQRAAMSDGRWMTPERRSGQRELPRLNEPSLDEKIGLTLGEPIRRQEGKGTTDMRRRRKG